MITTLTFCLILIPELYEGATPISCGIFALVVSFGMMQFVARAFEDRWLWPPRSQFNGFIYGEGIVLPVVVASEAAIYQDWGSNNLLYGWYFWIVVILGISLAVAASNRLREESSYSRLRFNSPSKLWHDVFVVPTMTFLLLFPLPALFYVPFGMYHLTACVAFVVWISLMSEPGSAKKIKTAHVEYDWARHKTTSARN